jgi:hypothetical protein
MVQENRDLSEEDVCIFMEENYQDLIDEALSPDDDSEQDSGEEWN